MGLDIGTSGVRAAELSLGKGAATLERFGQVALPLGAVRDGEVIDSDAVAGAIKQLWAQAKFSTKKVVVGVANQKVVVRQVDLPWLPVKELRQSLAFQVQDYIPMPVEQAILDFHPLEEFTNEHGRPHAARAARRRRPRHGRQRDGGRPARPACSRRWSTSRSFAVLRSQVTSSAGFAVEAEALVDVGASVTNIVVHQGGVPRFVRILLMGGGDITDAVAERLGVPADQAESVKQTTGLALDPEPGRGAPRQPRDRADRRCLRRGGPRLARLLPRPARRRPHRPRRPVRRRLPPHRPGRAAPGRDPPPGRGRPPDVRTQARQDRPDRGAALVRRAHGHRPGRPRPGGGVMSVLSDMQQATAQPVGTGVVALPKVNLLPPEIAEAARFRKVQFGLGGGVLARRRRRRAALRRRVGQPRATPTPSSTPSQATGDAAPGRGGEVRRRHRGLRPGRCRRGDAHRRPWARRSATRSSSTT